MTNSRSKGAGGEREAAKAWAELMGLHSRRGQQYCGGPDSPDIVIEGVPIHTEVKRLSRIAAVKFLRQAERDAARGSIPIALIREDGDGEWTVMVRLKELSRLSQSIAAATASARSL